MKQLIIVSLILFVLQVTKSHAQTEVLNRQRTLVISLERSLGDRENSILIEEISELVGGISTRNLNEGVVSLEFSNHDEEASKSIDEKLALLFKNKSKLKIREINEIDSARHIKRINSSKELKSELDLNNLSETHISESNYILNMPREFYSMSTTEQNKLKEIIESFGFVADRDRSSNSFRIFKNPLSNVKNSEEKLFRFISENGAQLTHIYQQRTSKQELSVLGNNMCKKVFLTPMR